MADTILVTAQTGQQANSNANWTTCRDNLVDDLGSLGVAATTAFICARGLIQFQGTFSNKLATAATLKIYSAAAAVEVDGTLVARIIKVPYETMAASTVTPENAQGQLTGTTIDMTFINSADKELVFELSEAALAFVNPNDGDFTCFLLNVNFDAPGAGPLTDNSATFRDDDYATVGLRPTLELTLVDAFTSMAPGMTKPIQEDLVHDMNGL